MSKSTKAESLERTKDSIGEKAMLVYDTIKTFKRPLTRAQIANLTGLKLSSVCGRANELIKAGLIEVCGKEWDVETQRNVEVLRAV